MIKDLSRFAMKYGLIPVAYGMLRLYFQLIRIRFFNEEMIVSHLNKGGKAIAALWHQRILIAFGYAGRFGQFSPAVMISRSRDGEMIADVYRRLNFRPVRGSSSHGGRKALAEMIEDLADHAFAVHVPDGPQGPRGVIKPGLISMAQRSCIPIVPVYLSVNRAWVLNSWDRFLVPKPFSTITIRWDDPIPVPESLDEDAFEAVRLQIERKMRNNQDRDDRELGWKESFF